MIRGPAAIRRGSLLLLAGLLLSCALPRSQPPSTTPGPVPIHEPTVPTEPADRSEPVLRIALRERGHRFDLQLPAPGVAVEEGRGSLLHLQPRIIYRFELVPSPEPEEPSEVHWVQVGLVAHRDAAEQLARRAGELLDEPVEITTEIGSGLHRVQVGPLTEPERARELAVSLAQQGFPEPWLRRERRNADLSARLGLRVGNRPARPLPVSSLRISCRDPDQQWFQLDGRRYRGLLELRLEAGGGITAINHVTLEDYVAGVVPTELGPAVFPELEALKAQAVAARTYALFHRNLRPNAPFHLCAGPACQAYGGMDAEHPLSDQAVRETRGSILTWNGQPIEALYTAHCGGHTEDVGQVFPGKDRPYLRGVPCLPSEPPPGWAPPVRSGSPPPRLHPERRVDRQAAELVAAGLLAPGELPDRPDEKPTAARIQALMADLAKVEAPSELDLPSFPETGEGLPRRWAARLLVQTIPRLKLSTRLLHPVEIEALLQVPDRSEIRTEDRSFLALALAEGALWPRSDGRLQPEQELTWDELMPFLLSAARSSGRLQEVEGRLIHWDDRGLHLGGAEHPGSFHLGSPGWLLLAPAGVDVGGWRWAKPADLAPEDRLRLILDSTGAAGLVVAIRHPGFPGYDGLGRDRSWEVVRSLEDLEEILAKRLPVEELQGIEILETGVSGRITRLRISDRRYDLILTGLRIRWALGLKEGLFDLHREFSPEGEERFRFVGRGTGHGVGLCQIGAFGMARRGRNHLEILAHYYQGAELILTPWAPLSTEADRLAGPPG